MSAAEYGTDDLGAAALALAKGHALRRIDGPRGGRATDRRELPSRRRGVSGPVRDVSRPAQGTAAPLLTPLPEETR